MFKQAIHNYLLTFFLLVIGFQSSESYASIYTASQPVTKEANYLDVSIFQEHSIHYFTTKYFYFAELIAELTIEDTDKKQKITESSDKDVISNSFYTLFLQYAYTNSELSRFHFDTSQLITSTPLYLRFEVFRL